MAANNGLNGKNCHGKTIPIPTFNQRNKDLRLLQLPHKIQWPKNKTDRTPGHPAPRKLLYFARSLDVGSVTMMWSDPRNKTVPVVAAYQDKIFWEAPDGSWVTISILDGAIEETELVLCSLGRQELVGFEKSRLESIPLPITSVIAGSAHLPPISSQTEQPRAIQLPNTRLLHSRSNSAQLYPVARSSDSRTMKQDIVEFSRKRKRDEEPSVIARKGQRLNGNDDDDGNLSRSVESKQPLKLDTEITPETSQFELEEVDELRAITDTELGAIVRANLRRKDLDSQRKIVKALLKKCFGAHRQSPSQSPSQNLNVRSNSSNDISEPSSKLKSSPSSALNGNNDCLTEANEVVNGLQHERRQQQLERPRRRYCQPLLVNTAKQHQVDQPHLQKTAKENKRTNEFLEFAEGNNQCPKFKQRVTKKRRRESEPGSLSVPRGQVQHPSRWVTEDPRKGYHSEKKRRLSRSGRSSMPLPLTAWNDQNELSNPDPNPQIHPASVLKVFESPASNLEDKAHTPDLMPPNTRRSPAAFGTAAATPGIEAAMISPITDPYQSSMSTGGEIVNETQSCAQAPIVSFDTESSAITPMAPVEPQPPTFSDSMPNHDQGLLDEHFPWQDFSTPEQIENSFPEDVPIDLSCLEDFLASVPPTNTLDGGTDMAATYAISLNADPNMRSAKENEQTAGQSLWGQMTKQEFETHKSPAQQAEDLSAPVLSLGIDQAYEDIGNRYFDPFLFINSAE